MLIKKGILFFCAIFLVQSCQYFQKNVPDKNELLKEELQKINFQKVDEFPSIAECDSLTDEAARKQCFFDFLTQKIQEKLATDTIKTLYPNLDTIQVKVTIFPDSRLKFQPYFSKDSMNYNTNTIDSIMQSKLTDFPIVQPAIKRGMKVKSEFVIPLILKK